jgi:hypothetical protein
MFKLDTMPNSAVSIPMPPAMASPPSPSEGQPDAMKETTSASPLRPFPVAEPSLGRLHQDEQ